MTIGTLIVGIELLVLRVILYDHVIKESCDFIERRISMKVTIMKSYHRQCGSGDKMILACHVILQDHKIKGTCEFMGRSP